jgi:hypothetical protein
MPDQPGRSQLLSLPRRVICDFLHFSQQIPTVTIGREMDLRPLVQARQAMAPRPSWCALFTHAYGKVVARRPDLRRIFLTFPCDRIHVQAGTTADVVVECNVHGEDALVNVPLTSPQERTAQQIDQLLTACKEHPLERVRVFRRALHIARLPKFLRRLIWWSILNVSACKRSRYWGTFGVTSVAGLGADSLRPICPWTTLLHYGVINREGRANVRLTYDHRVLDGTGPALALRDLENVLNTESVEELRQVKEAA